MLLEKNSNNRILIYFFYDGDGVVDDYVTVSLHGYRPYVKKIVFVCNGKLNKKDQEKLTPCVDELIVRENKGFDGWAYKAGIDSEGWDRLAEYDEMIMANHTIMGPVGSFGPMFETMNRKDLDFWGLTKNYEIAYDFTGWSKYGCIPEHIQSHFIAIRKSMLQSKEFHKYWDEFPEIVNYAQAIGCHEAIFTKHFADLGFHWEVFMNTDDIKEMCDYPLLNMPVEMLRRGCPFFKRRNFFHEYNHFLEQSIGTATMELMEYLEKETDYDTNLIWDNILRTCNMEDITRCLQLNYIVPSRLSDSAKTAEIGTRRKVALLMHVYFEELFDEMYQYASSMPEYADVYLTVSDEKKKKILEEKFSTLPVHKVEVILCNNRGRDVSAGLIVGKDLIDQYDYICFAHDKKTTQLKNGLVGKGFSDRCFNNILWNQHVVANILSLFEDNARLGMLGTAFPNHGEYFQLYGNEWAMNFENTKKLAEEMGIHVPMDARKMPITGYGSVFWFRTDALRKLYERDWKYEDFPQEPLPVDGTISHAIERLRPFVAQAAGYYSSFVMADVYARVEYTNLSFYLRQYQSVMGSVQAVMAAQQYGDGAAGLNLQGVANRILEQQKQQDAVQQYIRELEERVSVKGIFKRIIRRIFPFIGKKKD